MENRRMSLSERVARGALGVGLLACYGFNTSAVWALAGIIPLLTALLNFCPLYLLRRRPSLASASAGASASGPALESQAPLQSSSVGATESPAATASPEASAAEDPPATTRKSTGHRKAKGKLRRAKPAANLPTAGQVLHATDASFDKLVLESPVPVLVDFWADWCAPCRAMAPAIDELARELGDRARIVKVDVERARRVAGEYGIRSIPTLALFQGGEVSDVLIGIQSKEKLSRLLQRAAN